MANLEKGQQIFFGNKDIKVLSKLASTQFEGTLDYAMLITNEADIPQTLIFDYDSIAEFEATTGASSPQLVEALKIAFTRKDKQGNPLVPKCGFVSVLGIAQDIETQDFYSALDTALAEAEYPYYTMIFVQHTKKGKEWANLYPKRILPYFTDTEDYALTTAEQGKIRVHLDVDSKYTHVAEACTFVFPKRLAQIKFMPLNGINSYSFKDGEVELLDTTGRAIYRTVNGKGQISNSLCTDGSHLDTKYVTDTIIYNLASTILKMFEDEDIFDDNVTGELENRLNKSLTFMGQKLGIISRDGATFKYSIYIPQIDGTVRSTRELEGILIRVIYRTAMEKIGGVAEQVMEERELVITATELGEVTL